MIPVTEEYLQRGLYTDLGIALAERPGTAKFLTELGQYTNFAIYGGSLRDLLLFGKIEGDLDIVTECTDEALKSFISKYWKTNKAFLCEETSSPVNGEISSRGMFGGWKLNFNNDSMDIWAFERTLGLLPFDRYKNPWQELVDRTDFSCNCIALMIDAKLGNSKLYHSRDYFKLLNDRIIDINNPLSFPADTSDSRWKLAKRALKQMYKKRLAPTKNMASFLSQSLGGRELSDE